MTNILATLCVVVSVSERAPYQHASGLDARNRPGTIDRVRMVPDSGSAVSDDFLSEDHYCSLGHDVVIASCSLPILIRLAFLQVGPSFVTHPTRATFHILQSHHH